MNVAVMDNQHPNAVPPPAKSKHAGIQQRHQAAALQRLAFDGAMSLKVACTDKASGRVTMDVKTAVAVHKLIGAWDTAADRLRVLKGKGLPASVKARPRGSTPQPEPLDPT